MNRTCVILALAAGSAAFVASSTHAQTFQGLGHLPGGNHSSASSISADGMVVVGSVRDGAGNDLAFRWTRNSGYELLGTMMGGSHSYASGVSADGSVIVGASEMSNGEMRAFRWSAGDGMVPLAHQPGWRASWGSAVSADGTIVVGTITKNDDYTNGVRWAGVAVQDVFSALPGSYWISVSDASADGSVLCGYNGIPFMSDEQAYRWTAVSGPQAITPGAEALDAGAISEDGTVIVGTTQSRQPYRWTETGGLEILPLPPVANIGGAHDVSPGGTLVVGTVSYLFDKYAAMWTQEGFVMAQEALGAAVPAGWTLTSVSAVSADGRTIVGDGINPFGVREAWIAMLSGTVCTADLNEDGVLTLQDFVEFRNLYTAGDPLADFDANGVLTLNDFAAFRNAYAAGCD